MNGQRTLALALLLASGCQAEEPRVQIQPTIPPCDPSIAAPSTFERSPGGVPEVSASWVAAHRCQVRVVDVREPEELRASRLDFAEHVPLARLAEEAAAWDADDPIVLVCRSGRRSARATRMLEDMGFTRAASMTGGLLVWESRGYPLDAHRSVDGAPAPSRVAAADRAIDRAAIEAHLGDPTRIRWVKAAALLMQGTQSCVDGRDERPVVGTPGGDAGELLLALAALERARGTSIEPPEVGHLMDAYLDAFGRFYVHTDEEAVAGVAADPRFAASVRELGMERFLHHPPRELEPALLEALTSPEHVGCGHLRLSLLHPEEYGVRRELGAALLRAVYTRYWQGEAIELVILEGAHHEQAVVDVRLDHEVHAFTRIPTITPRLGDREIFVSHSEVSAWLRRENAAFLFEVDPWLRAHPDRREAFLNTLEGLGEAQRSATLAHLARDLPVYRAHVSADAVRVEGPLE